MVLSAFVDITFLMEKIEIVKIIFLNVFLPLLYIYRTDDQL